MRPTTPTAWTDREGAALGDGIRLDTSAWFAGLEAPATTSFAYPFCDAALGYIDTFLTVRKERRQRWALLGRLRRDTGPCCPVSSRPAPVSRRSRNRGSRGGSPLVGLRPTPSAPRACRWSRHDRAASTEMQVMPEYAALRHAALASAGRPFPVANDLHPPYLTNLFHVIPALCAKGGVPRSDARGRISSHRARSTIASQLFNAREPMSLFELQAWLGHRSPASTQSYVAITPTKLAQAYADAGYFARNLRTIEVLIDRDTVQSGAAAHGVPWQYFDLGHGYCTYSFFDQCPHRLACARCDFYLPKGSTKAQLLEAKGHLQRMRATIPLADEERAAVEDGTEALDRLLDRLVDVPTPAGPTPRQLTGRQLPVIQSTKG